MLLHWGTLEPHGGSRLASVRFSGPVRIRAIRIHPKGASLFTQHQEAISETEPDAFALSVFLTAQSAPTAQEPKPKGTNVLVPTRLSYTGGLREFPLDMGPDFVTRLMIVQGDFERATIAVYGDAIPEPVVTPVSYEPLPLPQVPRRHLSSALDPCNTVDPIFLSGELLALISDAPTFPLVIRMMFCFSAPDEPWESDSFAYSSLEECLEVDLSGLDWLAKAVETLMGPISKDVSTEVLKKFAEKVLEVISEKTYDSLCTMSGLLRYASAQPTIVLLAILDVLDMPDILDLNLIDKHILDRLQDAAANPIMARVLRTTPVLDTLQTLRDADSTSRSVKDATTRLLQRVNGWERFEKALSTSTPDISTVARWIKEIASEDMTFGVFLLSMIEDESLASKLSGHPIQEQGTLPITPWTSIGLASLTEFAAFMRALIGVSCVLVVLCWSDHVSDSSCTERILALIRLWQDVDGYSEVVNHLLLIPQLTYHLESILKNSTSSPTAGLIHVEQILACLLAQPETMSRPELATLVNALSDPCASISEDERQEMVEISMIAEGGLSEAVDAVLNWFNRPVETSGARTLQTALLILENTLEDREKGEWRIMQAAWERGSHGLVYCLVEMFNDFLAPIRNQFLLTPPPPLRPPNLLRLLTSCNAILRILSRMVPVHPLPGRLTRDLTCNIASLFIATDAFDSRFPQGSAACQAARVTRPTCAEAISILSSIPDESEPGRVCGELVLRTLLHTSLYPEGDDPVIRLEQVFWLLDLVLPLSLSDASGDRTEQRFWTRKVLSNVLPELQRFMRALAVDHQILLVKRLVDLDRGEVALGQWFVDEELKYLISTLESIKNPESDLDTQSISRARVFNSFQFLSGLIEATSAGGPLQFFGEPHTIEDTSHILSCLLDNAITVSSVLNFACLLAPHASLMEPPIRLDLTLTILRGASAWPSVFLSAGTILPHIRQAQTMEVIRVAGELGPTLQRAVEDEQWQSYWRQEDERVTHVIVSLLSWLVSQPMPETLLLPGISEASFTELLERVAAAAPHNEKLTSDLRAKFIFSDDVVMRPVVDEPETLTLSTNRLSELLTTPSMVPSTPRLSGESIFKMATLSPVTALVGTSKISTLTKNYQKNDFRQLSVRQNTSRRPSMHVDDFEQGSAVLASPIAVHPSLPAPFITADYFQQLPPPQPESE